MNIVHIGLPKAASTTLQDSVFAQQKQFAYLGPVDNKFANQRVKELIWRISFQDSLDYDPLKAKALVEELRQASKPFLISNEGFSEEGGADRRLIAERLHELFAPAKVILIVRAQPSLCQSLYLMYIRSSGQGITSFDQWLGENYAGIYYQDRFRVGLDYERLVRCYEDVFGQDNVVVLPFEWIGDEDSPFAATTADLLQMSLSSVQQLLKGKVANPRMSRRNLFVLHLQSLLPRGTDLAMLGRRLMPLRLYKLFHGFVTGGTRVKSPELSEDWKSHISEMCADGNSKLEQRKKLVLRALGYPVSKIW